MRFAPALLLLAIASPARADVMPELGADNPRLQSVAYASGERVLLTAMPQSALTVMLEPGEKVERAVLDGGQQFDVTVSAEGDSFTLVPHGPASSGTLEVQTDRRSYDFALQTGTGLTAAYLVRFRYGGPRPTSYRPPATPAPAPPAQIWSYRLKGDREVEPASIGDDGSKTFITFGPDQPLPAVFAIGATGDEEVVNGYMRGDRYVIDRVIRQLVFRIDKKKAVATRNDKPEDAG